MAFINQLQAVLVVDDDPDVLIILRHSVELYAPNYDVIALNDGQSALKELSRRTVPLLITDYMMPGMNGLELAAAVKAASPITHVILATAYGSAQLKERARTAHVDTYLSKVELFDRLGDVVRSILQP
ncbi:MAG TPA: response regulator [Roseiflexaceae bacterium]|nr:response regulator [Roseiflexaceae bacterium]